MIEPNEKPFPGALTKMEQRRFSRSNLLFGVVPFIIYSVLSLIFFSKAGSWTDWLLAPGGDGGSFVWFIHWWPFAFAHHLNPFISHYVWFPGGDNFAWRTAVPTAALLTLPVTWFAGPVFSFNLLTLLAPALSAWMVFLLARRLTGDWCASLVGGYLFGFSSYEFGQMLGHLNLDLTFLVPLGILLCVQRAYGDLGRAAFVAALAVVLLLELGVSTEVFATFGVFGAITWIIFFACAPAADRPKLWSLALDIIFAVFATAILAAPFLFYMAKGFHNVPPTINSPTTYSADLLNYFVPTSVTRFGRSIFSAIAGQFTANPSEQGAYLGLPYIFLLAFYFRDQIILPYVRALLIVMIVLAVFSLGPWLQLAGQNTHLPLPWWFGEKLPLLSAALPARFTMYVSLIAATAAALYLAQPGIGLWRIARYALAGLAILFLLPNMKIYAWPRWPAQAFFTPQNVRQALGANANVIILPFGGSGYGMEWQLDAGMQFTQTGGYTGFFPYAEDRFPILAELGVGQAGPTFGDDLAALCVSHRVNYILMAPGTPLSLITAINALGWPQRAVQGVEVVTVPPISKLDFYDAVGDYAPSAGPEGWMGRQMKITTRQSPLILTLSGTEFLQKPVEISAISNAARSVYSIGPSTAQVISVPPHTSLTLTAKETFIPDNVLHNGDRRELSVLISIKKLAPPSNGS